MHKAYWHAKTYEWIIVQMLVDYPDINKYVL